MIFRTTHNDFVLKNFMYTTSLYTMYTMYYIYIVYVICIHTVCIHCIDIVYRSTTVSKRSCSAKYGNVALTVPVTVTERDSFCKACPSNLTSNLNKPHSGIQVSQLSYTILPHIYQALEILLHWRKSKHSLLHIIDETSGGRKLCNIP